MNNNRAFTLVELLAVLTVLSIIALIVVPMSINIISESKQKSNDLSLNLFLKAFENSLYAENIDVPSFNPEICDVNNGIVTCDDKDFNIETKNSNYINGVLHLENKEIKYYDLNVNGSFYSKGYTDERCFQTAVSTKSNSRVKIMGYYDYIDNDSSKDRCPLDVIIPSTIDGRNVVIINRLAFNNKNLTSVIIPSSVERIDYAAFLGNNLKHITIPKSVKLIGAYAFQYNELSDIYIPETVDTVEKYAFSINKLKSATIATHITDIPEGLFWKNELTEITIPDTVTYIGIYAFKENKLANVIIPNSVTIIDNQAFYKNQLTSLTIGNSVTSIGKYAFRENKLTSVTIPDSVTVLDEEAFQGNNLSSVRIGSKIKNVNREAFGAVSFEDYGRNQISTMIIDAHEEDVTVGNNAFAGVTGTICWLKDDSTCGTNEN